jgi:two-component system cell cycle sensor histidine kinase/response regulator CckA
MTQHDSDAAPESDSPVTPRGKRNSRPVIDPVAGLAGSIAHDFSGLLMIIRNAGAFLKDELGPDDPRQRHVSMLLQAADRAARLTSQLQAFGGSQLLKPEIVRPARVVRGISETLRHLVPEDVDFRISIRAPEATVLFDAIQLQVVIMNLVTSAAERVRTHGRLLLAISEETFDNVPLEDGKVLDGKYLSIFVSKTGEGMEDGEKKQAFAPRLTGKTLPRGTDLRLASVHGVVTQSGGFVDMSSERGQGTTFRVLLPIVEPDLKPATVSAAHRARALGEITGNEVVLVVEDDQAVRQTVREALELYGYTVYEASDGAEALHISELFSGPPDLLLTDLVMPEVSGRELIEGLRNEGRLPKVLMMSGYTDDEVIRRRAKPSEGYPFIKKPFTHQELARKVRETLDEQTVVIA